MTITIESMVERWSGLERPLFKGKLIDANGCKCAQGDVLSCAGYTDGQLRLMAQGVADNETARLLGISRTHAVLLRTVNDRRDGCPQFVLSAPEKILGDKAQHLLSFWLFLDQMTDAARDAAGDAARDAARYAASAAANAAWYAAWYAAGDAARYAAWDAARYAASAAANAADVARHSASYASNEIQGMDVLEKDGKSPYFLSLFGFDTWNKVRDLVK